MRRFLLFAFAASFVFALRASPVVAKRKTKKKAWVRTGPYLGVQPGVQDRAPGRTHLKTRKQVRYLTWVGFQMIGQGGRVFVQGNEPPVFNFMPGPPDTLVLEFPDTRLVAKNDGRLMETGWFPTAVEWLDADQLRGNTTRLTIKLREVVGYDLRQEGNYLFLDFRAPTKPIVPPVLPRTKEKVAADR